MQIQTLFSLLRTATGLPPRTAARLGHNKVCNLEDFAHPDVRDVIRTVFAHELRRFGSDFPAGREYRKHWEVAMAVRTFADHGVLRPDAEVLGVAAGNEPTVFWLTNHVRRVFATDLYLQEGAWGESANASMLVAPDRHWPAPRNTATSSSTSSTGAGTRTSSCATASTSSPVSTWRCASWRPSGGRQQGALEGLDQVLPADALVGQDPAATRQQVAPPVPGADV